MAAQVGVFSLPKKQKQKQPNNNSKKKQLQLINVNYSLHLEIFNHLGLLFLAGVFL